LCTVSLRIKQELASGTRDGSADKWTSFTKSLVTLFAVAWFENLVFGLDGHSVGGSGARKSCTILGRPKVHGEGVGGISSHLYGKSRQRSFIAVSDDVMEREGSRTNGPPLFSSNKEKAPVFPKSIQFDSS